MSISYLRKHRQLLLLIVAAIILDLYILRNSINIGVIQSADWPIPVPNLKFLFYYTFPAWSYQDMSSNGFNVFLLSYGFLSSISHNPAMTQKIFYYIPWALTPFSAYILLSFIGLKRSRIFFSLLYQFGPWMTGQFMDGEPVNVMLYLFIPLIFYVVMKFNSNLSKLYRYSTIVMVIPSFFTLEAPFFYIMLIIPFLLYIFWHNGIKYALERILIIALSFLTIILFNIYSLLPYIDAYSGASPSSSSIVNSFIEFPPAIVEKYWLILIAVCLIIITLLLMARDKTDIKTFFQFFTLISVILVIIYPGLISNNIGVYIITKIPILAPFINPNEFLLYVWFELLLATAYSFNILDIKTLDKNKGKLKHAYSVLKKPTVLIITVGIVILLISSATIEIQSFGSHDTDIHMFTQGPEFDKTQIKPQYEYLLKYLESHGVSYNLSFHTIILPENPARTLPFYIGADMIPGYEGLFNESISTNIINGINAENSSFLMLLSILGIKYIAVMNIPSNPTWYGSNGTPQLSMWGNKNIFIGNYTYYLKDLGNISGLKDVYNNNGIWIFDNEYYKSPILESNYTYINNVLSGNYSKMYTVENISGNLLNEPEWCYSGGNYSINSNLNFSLHKSSSSLIVYNYTYLPPNSTYELSFNFNTTGLSNLYYGNGQNGIMLFYNVTKSYSDVIGGTVITIAPEKVANGTYSAFFKVPDYNTPVPVQFLIQLQPPVTQNTIHVTISNLAVHQVRITNNFNKYFTSVSYKVEGLTTLELFNVSKNESVTVDQSYAPGWYIKNTDSEMYKNSKSGIMELNISDPGNIAVYYTYQNIYNYLLIISFASMTLFTAFALAYEIKKLKAKMITK